VARGLALDDAVRGRPRVAPPRRLLVRRVAGGTFVFVPGVIYTCGMSASDKRKQSLYFPEEMLKEIGAEATRQDRSLSWIVQKAWKAARKDLMSIPSVSDTPDEPAKSDPTK